MLAAGGKKGMWPKGSNGTAAPSLRQGNWFIIGINGQDQMTVAILLLFESFKEVSTS
jgi:hypothetical protein